MRMVLFQPSDQLLYMGGATSSMTPYRTTIYIRPALLQNCFQSLKGFEGKKTKHFVFLVHSLFWNLHEQNKKIKKIKKWKEKKKRNCVSKLKKNKNKSKLTRNSKSWVQDPGDPGTITFSSNQAIFKVAKCFKSIIKCAPFYTQTLKLGTWFWKYKVMYQHHHSKLLHSPLVSLK